MKEPLLKDRYQILECLFNSRHTRVYLACDEEYKNQLVAIKETRQTILDDWATEEVPALISAIKREPRLLATLSHPNIPYYSTHFDDNDGWYLVMELVDGQNLRLWLEKTLPSENVHEAPNVRRTKKLLAVAIQLCEALTYLHERSPIIVHRDIKPSNIMVTPQGMVKLVDFGLSHALNGGNMSRAFEGLTWGYAAPEQERGEKSSPRMDIYALGVTLSCLLVNRHSPPDATSDQFTPSETIQPTALRTLLTQMTEQDPTKRPATARYLGMTFRAILAEVFGEPCTEELLSQLLASPSVTYQTKGKWKTCYEGQTLWYQFRLSTRRRVRLDVPAKITSIRFRSYGPDVEITFVNPYEGQTEQRWIHPSQLWKLVAN